MGGGGVELCKWQRRREFNALGAEVFRIAMRGGRTEGDSCSQHKDGAGRLDEPGPEGVTSRLGNVTATREGERIGGAGGIPPSLPWAGI